LIFRFGDVAFSGGQIHLKAEEPSGFPQNYMGVSKNGDTPKWTVYNGKPY